MVNQSQSQSQSLISSLAFGTIGGFIAGLAITPLVMLIGVLAGFSEKAILFALGTAFGADPDNAIIVGVVAHLLLSTLIGLVFGLIIYKIKRLRITSVRKGIIEGIIAGIIVFIVIFIPLSLIVIPSVIVGIIKEINLGMTEQQTTFTLQQAMPIILTAGIIGYVIYGLILGTITALLTKVRTSRGKSKTAENNKI